MQNLGAGANDMSFHTMVRFHFVCEVVLQIKANWLNRLESLLENQSLEVPRRIKAQWIRPKNGTVLCWADLLSSTLCGYGENVEEIRSALTPRLIVEDIKL